MNGDLHIHSYYSDGLHSPEEVMRFARDAGCDVASLTDHDTTDGLLRARAAAKELGLGFVDGVEVSSFDEVETHILGYGMDIDNPRFVRFIDFQKSKRRERAVKLFAKLEEFGFTFDMAQFDIPVKREITRSHIAAAMVRQGYEKDFRTAFDKWLKVGAPAYVFMEDVCPEIAIEEIHASGGLAVLAHPVRLDLDRYERAKHIERLARGGLDGIEAVYKRSSRSVVKELREIATRHGLFVTAGADFHRDGHEIIARRLNCPQITELAK